MMMEEERRCVCYVKGREREREREKRKVRESSEQAEASIVGGVAKMRLNPRR